jgi:hypothetical protein
MLLRQLLIADSKLRRLLRGAAYMLLPVSGCGIGCRSWCCCSVGSAAAARAATALPPQVAASIPPLTLHVNLPLLLAKHCVCGSLTAQVTSCSWPAASGHQSKWRIAHVSCWHCWLCRSQKLPRGQLPAMHADKARLHATLLPF